MYLIYKIYSLMRLILFVQLREQPDLNIFFGYEFNVLDVGFQFLISNEIDNFAIGINTVPLLLILIVVLGYPGAGRRRSKRPRRRARRTDRPGAQPFSANAASASPLRR